MVIAAVVETLLQNRSFLNFLNPRNMLLEDFFNFDIFPVGIGLEVCDLSSCILPVIFRTYSCIYDGRTGLIVHNKCLIK